MNYDVNAKASQIQKLKNSLAESREFRVIENTVNESKLDQKNLKISGVFWRQGLASWQQDLEGDQEYWEKAKWAFGEQVA